MTTVNIDYTSRDFEGLRASLLDYARTAFPDWVPSSEGDFGILMVELLSYTGDILSYYVDRAQNEAYLPTATQRASILNIAKLLGYKVSTGAPSSGTVTLRAATGGPAVDVPAGTQLATGYIDSLDGPIIFETTTDVTVPAEGTITVGVLEGETKTDETSGGPLAISTSSGYPDQAYRLPHPRVYQDTVEVWIGDDQWHMIDHLLDAEPSEKAFSVDVDASGYTWITFGDGLNGAIPPLGVDITARYRVGFGLSGNVGTGAIVSIYKPITGLSLDMATAEKSTSTETTGGADPESNEAIRVNAPRAFKANERAVTLDDFSNFALAVPGVAKASATAEFFSSVAIYILGPEATTPTNALVDSVQQSVQDRALAGVTVTVSAPSRIGIQVGSSVNPVAVGVWPTYSNSKVQFAVEQAIKEFFAFTNCEIGQRLTVSQLYSAIMAVEGVRYADIPLMTRVDVVQTDASDIQLRPTEFPIVADVSGVSQVFVTATGGIG